MFKKWWFGNDLSTPFTGNEDYNRIEATVGTDPVNPLTFNRLAENLFTNNKELYDYITILNNNKNIPNGVVKNIGDNFYLDLTNFLSVTTQDETYKIFQAPTGLVLNNGNIYFSTENYFLAIRQLCAALRIDPVSTDENVNLYRGIIQEANEDANPPTPDIYGYICTVSKHIDGTLTTRTYKDVNALQLLLRIAGKISDNTYGNNDPGFPYFITRYFIDSLGNFKPQFFKLREMFPYEDSISYFLGIKNDKITLQTILESTDIFSDDPNDVLLYRIDIVSGNITIEDYRNFSSVCESFGDKIFLNADSSTNDTHDLTTLENPLTDNTLDYTNIENKNSFITTLSKDSGSNNNAVFGYIQPESSIDEIYGLSGSTDASGSDSFFINKNIWLKTGTGTGAAGYVSLKNFIDSQKGFPSVPSFTDLEDTVSIDNINTYAPTYLAIEENTFYSWIEVSRDTQQVYLRWVPVENPFVQPYNMNRTIDFNNGSPVSTMTFAQFKTYFDNNSANRLNLRSDGTNFYVFADGSFVPFSSDGTTLTFSPAIPANTQKLTCVAVKGGEQYRAAYSVVQAGTGEGTGEPNYSGSLCKYTITNKVEALPDKINVFVNGVLKNEAPQFTSGTIISHSAGSGAITNIIELDVGAEPDDGDYLLDNNIHKVFIIKKSNDITYIISFDNMTATGMAPGDTCEIYKKGIYDYFIEQDDNSIIFFNPLTTGDTVRVEDRVSVISNMNINSVGSVLPSNPLFGMEFYLTSELNETQSQTDYNLDNDSLDVLNPGWYKFDGTSWRYLG